MGKNQNCDLFSFMSDTVGISVLHPGGYRATFELCSMLEINSGSQVLDVACGTGTTALYLSDKYGCDVTGFDISENLIAIAKKNLGKKNRDGKVRFEVADVLCLPYADNSFDVVIAQAFFVLTDEKDKAMKEIVRVLKPGGCFGSLELGWFRTPPAEIREELIHKTCNSIIPRVLRFDEWEALFSSAGLTLLKTKKHPMTSGMSEMFQTEGFINSTRVMFRMLADAGVRRRMMEVQNTFRKYNDYLGYGLFGCRKSQ
jgi:ubiquinone/menaquinone biosynthesis C-methylase UbiE